MYSSLTVLTLVTMPKTFADRTNVLEEECEDKLGGKGRGAKRETFNTTIEQVECTVANKRGKDIKECRVKANLPTLVTMPKTFAERTNVLEEGCGDRLEGGDRGSKRKTFDPAPEHDVAKI